MQHFVSACDAHDVLFKLVVLHRISEATLRHYIDTLQLLVYLGTDNCCLMKLIRLR